MNKKHNNKSDNCIVNLTSLILPDNCNSLLSFGPQFAIPLNNIKNMPYRALLIDIEYCINNLNLNFFF